MQLGHDLAAANVIMIKGLPWDHSTFDQFVARVHRLTSKRDVTVYIVMTEGTVDERKWNLINQKGAASQLALDGELFDQHTEELDLQAILDELREKGYDSTGNIPEDQVKKMWKKSLMVPAQPVIPQPAKEISRTPIDPAISLQLSLFNKPKPRTDWKIKDTSTAEQVDMFALLLPNGKENNNGGGKDSEFKDKASNDPKTKGGVNNHDRYRAADSASTRGDSQTATLTKGAWTKKRTGNRRDRQIQSDNLQVGIPKTESQEDLISVYTFRPGS